MQIQIGAVLSGVRTMKDRSYRLTFDTGEMAPEVGACLLAMIQNFGFLAYASEDESQIVIPDELPKDESERYTQSQVLRFKLKELWEKDKETETFEEFRRIMMEKIIAGVQRKIDHGEDPR